ncbi:MAG: LmbE family protein [Flavobacteriaceae bacterium TMED179]|nr:MAG: LmbE family protein [Flavobacteriaceae bacterium TMED179]
MRKVFLFFFLTSLSAIFSQDSARILKQLQKLNTLCSVLYVAAHPDDENTRLISLFSNQYNARTAYLSLTRGDGGQNLIGTELREELGLIRTQELLEARKIDGGQQFFTTANDFGFSKNPDETLNIWNEKEILSQIVFRIRAFKPDIIIHRFDHRTPGSTHGHHTSSSMLSEKAFHLSNDPNAFPEQLNRVSLWQTNRQFYNTSWWAYGGRENFKKADKSNMIPLESNPVDLLLGRTNEEVAAKSRSQHKSQGFGSSPKLGSQTEYLELINGNKPSNTNPLDGIDISWNRVEGGNNIKKQIEAIVSDFDIEKPYKSVSALAEVYQLIRNLENNHWKKIKLAEVKKLIKNCLRLRLQFNTFKETGVPESYIPVEIKVINPSPISVKLISVDGLLKLEPSKILIQNKVWKRLKNIKLPNENTTPYWLLKEGNLGNYEVQNENFKGLPETPNLLKAKISIQINNIVIPIDIPLTYRSTDRVAGEVIQNFQILPRVTTKLNKKVILFQDDLSKKVRLQVLSHINNFRGKVSLNTPEGWTVLPQSQKVEIKKTGVSKEYIFEVTPPKGNCTGNFSSIVTEGEKNYDMSLKEINYPHISKQFLLSPNKTTASRIDIKTNVNKVAYLNGAGDKVAESLRNLGISVTEINVNDLRLESLLSYPTLIVGIRAFNVHKELAYKNKILWDYVKQGGTVIVQYNTSRGFDSSQMAPYPIKISRDRVTNENAEVRFLQKNHLLLNKPNKISSKDFDDWVQERGLYFAYDWDDRYQTLFSMNDKGEKPKNGSLLVADYGEGKFIFTGLSFFRELPAGVPGAYRLFINLISYGK